MKIALVTGANRGIGLAAARRLARECNQVIVTARDGEAGREAAERLAREGLCVMAVTMDVTDVASVRAAAAYVGERFGHLDVLVNNAGILPEATHAHPAEVVDLGVFEQTYATNVLGRSRSWRRSCRCSARARRGGS